MRVAVGVLTYENLRNDRKNLFLETLRSLRDNTNFPFDLFLVDNNSQDGTADLVAKLGGYCSTTYPTTCGHGMNVTLGILSSCGADLCVFSNDDIWWKPGYLERLVKFWKEAPDDLLICSGHLEPEFFWNTPRELVTYGGVKALVRDTAPGGTWTFRARDWPIIGPVPETHGIDDVPTCQRLLAQGYRVAQMDAATHVGVECSTWGNRSDVFGKPLDREAWGLG